MMLAEPEVGDGMKLQRGTRWWKRQGAGTLVEYALILFIVSIVAVLMLKGIGQTTNRLLESTNNNMPQ